jgi:predicted phosphodiesterase
MANNRLCESPLCDNDFDPIVHNQKFCKQQCKRDAENITRRRPATSTRSALEVEKAILAPDDELTAEDSFEYLRKLNVRLHQENQRLKLAHKELSSVVYVAVKEHLRDNPLPVTTAPKADKRKTAVAEVACSVLSDWQLGKKTVDYDVETCIKRINLFAEKQLRITDIQRNDHPVRDCRMWVLGDMVEGEAIFPGQAHHIDASLHTQVMKTAELLANHTRRMLENYDNVHFVGVSGNHGAIGGRDRHEMHPETNSDRMVYNIVKMILDTEKRVTWDIPLGTTEGDFYTMDKIGSKRILLFHGHQIRGAGSQAAIEKRIKSWYMGAIKEPFDYALMGHFHNPTRYTINTATAYINGTTESSNGWAMEVMGAVGRPCQYLLYMHPDHGVTAEYPIYLDH